MTTKFEVGTHKVHGNIVRRKIGLDDKGVEHFLPFGSYSMCTSIGADSKE